ncbi:hypothetical protein BaRGS_00007159 [Batillaria attramentaria]|uniref:Centromere protein H C-terminal domain-containing protein n=1 Tax=Batillaria attramentaria TaxID=370345 RepID=A0ABD0LQJ6_9CAEN
MEESVAIRLPQIDAITDVLSTREWLESLRRDQEATLVAEKSIIADTEDLDVLQERIQFGQVLSEKMFSAPLPTAGDDASADITSDGRRAYESLLQDQSKLSSEVLRKQETADELQKELDAVRKRNFELKKRNRHLMGIIEQHRKRLEKTADQVKSNAACRELKEELESTVSRVEIAKSTLQALIVGSGVNWARDPELLETVLLCGEPLHL